MHRSLNTMKKDYQIKTRITIISILQEHWELASITLNKFQKLTLLPFYKNKRKLISYR